MAEWVEPGTEEPGTATPSTEGSRADADVGAHAAVDRDGDGVDLFDSEYPDREYPDTGYRNAEHGDADYASTQDQETGYIETGVPSSEYGGTQYTEAQDTGAHDTATEDDTNDYDLTGVDTSRYELANPGAASYQSPGHGATDHDMTDRDRADQTSVPADLTKHGSSHSDPSLDHEEAGRRGSLGVKDKVIEKMVTRATLDVPGVARHGTGFDRLTGREFPRVHVNVSGGHVRVKLEIAVLWPHPLADVSATVRDEVGHHLTRLSGLEVDAVDVDVPTIVTPSADTAPTRRVQ